MEGDKQCPRLLIQQTGEQTTYLPLPVDMKVSPWCL